MPHQSIDVNLDIIKGWVLNLYQKKKFNGIIAFVKDDVVIFKYAAGYKSYKQEPIQENTKLRLASLSKSFTGFGVMLLSKNYDVSYDDPVSKYIKQFPIQDISIRQLLHHSSGIEVDYILLAKKYKPKTPNYILSIKDASILISKYVKHKYDGAGKKFNYNNSNYILLARIIEIVSGLSFEYYMKQEVFNSLKLNNTRVWNLLSEYTKEENDLFSEGFKSYFKSKKIKVQPKWTEGVAGDSGVFSTINDLIKWSNLWDLNPLLDNEEIQEALTFPNLNSGVKFSHGFGWHLKENTIIQEGKKLATNAIMVKNFKNSTTLILVDNSNNPRFKKIYNELTKNLDNLFNHK
ncbi:serine hydrolase domain-containing protein [Tenacibaculum amylolyticum]|uniref:serine hydrolase domain-containing protein n=1 Tax=Tenacibaculum amylolyticum TaxID=104269 RepID=UPI0038B52A1B